MQQLRDGIDNFFVTFIHVERERARTSEPSLEVEPGVTVGDYLEGFWLGTRQALYENGRDSMTLTLKNVDARAVGVLIAIYERAVGFYASLVGINAYHQPGVEAGKKAAAAVIELKGKVEGALREAGAEALDAETVAARAGSADVETVFHLLEHLANNPGRGVTKVETSAGDDRPPARGAADKSAYLRAKFRRG